MMPAFNNGHCSQLRPLIQIGLATPYYFHYQILHFHLYWRRFFADTLFQPDDTLSIAAYFIAIVPPQSASAFSFGFHAARRRYWLPSADYD